MYICIQHDLSGSSECRRLIDILIGQRNQCGWNGNVLNFFVRSSNWQNFEFWGKIGNGDNFFAETRPACSPKIGKKLSPLPILPPKCLQNSKFCQSDDLEKKFKTFPFQPRWFQSKLQPIRLSTSQQHSEEPDKSFCIWHIGNIWSKLEEEEDRKKEDRKVLNDFNKKWCPI